MTNQDLWSVQKLISSTSTLGHAGQRLKLNRWKTISPQLTCDRALALAERKMRRSLSNFQCVSGVPEALPIGSITEEVES
jgi:hypothetical protein